MLFISFWISKSIGAIQLIMYMVNVTYGTNISPDTLVELAFHGIQSSKVYFVRLTTYFFITSTG